jgi:histidine triad (HIT) family protein
MTTDPSCTFCQIIAGDSPVSTVTEDETVVAFMDIHPVTPGHMLIVPREHHAELATVPGETLSHMMLVAQWLVAALRASPIRTDGINLHLSDGSAAGQIVFHTHLHVIPRWRGDGFLVGAKRRLRPSRGELNRDAATIRTEAVG